jgi:hypothetical protein
MVAGMVAVIACIALLAREARGRETVEEVLADAARAAGGGTDEEAARLGSDWRALFQPREHGGEREGRGKLRERHRADSVKSPDFF